MSILRSIIIITLSSGITYWYADHVRWRRAIDAKLGVEKESVLSEI